MLECLNILFNDCRFVTYNSSVGGEGWNVRIPTDA